MLAVDKDLAVDAVDDLRLVLGAAVLQHVLDDIVAILVLHQTFCLLMELRQHAVGLLRRAVLQDALDDTAAVRVCGQVVHLLQKADRSSHSRKGSRTGHTPVTDNGQIK